MPTIAEFQTTHARWAALVELATVNPLLPLKNALDSIIEDVPIVSVDLYGQPLPVSPYTGSVHDAKALGEWGMTQATVTQYLAPFIDGGSTSWGPTDSGTTKKINAIKELRAVSFAGLKEAKEGVEYMLWQYYGHPKPHGVGY